MIHERKLRRKGALMAGETVITVMGTVTADPELRFVSNGSAVTNFTVASNSRRLNKETGKWEDADALFLRCNIWRQAAENTAESLSKGDRVIVVGRLKQRSYETREGEKRTVMELEVDDLGPSIKFRPAQISKATRDSGGASASDDPWATATSVGASNGGAAGYDENPPY